MAKNLDNPAGFYRVQGQYAEAKRRFMHTLMILEEALEPPPASPRSSRAGAASGSPGSRRTRPSVDWCGATGTAWVDSRDRRKRKRCRSPPARRAGALPLPRRGLGPYHARYPGHGRIALVATSGRASLDVAFKKAPHGPSERAAHVFDKARHRNAPLHGWHLGRRPDERVAGGEATVEHIELTRREG